MSNLARRVFLSGEAAERQADRRDREKKKLTALPHSIHLSRSLRHQFIHFHMTTARGTTRNGFISRIIHYNLSFFLYNYLCASIMEKQCERAKLQMKYKKRNGFQRQSSVFFCRIHLIILDCSWQNPLWL